MYAKLVRTTRKTDRPTLPYEVEVTPKESAVFEGKIFKYRKFVGIGGLQKIVDEHHLNGDTVFWSDHVADIDNKRDGKEMEFVYLTVVGTDGRSEHYLASNCQLFIMNDTGKTIDSIYCFERQPSQSSRS